MGAMSRNKGKRGEREVAAIISDLLGVSASRRVRQREGDSDILGVPGWSIEVKRCEKADPADIRRWWAQAVAQALATSECVLPALFYRPSRRDWRVVWPASALLAGDTAWLDYEQTAESSPEVWASVVREVAR